MTSSVAQPDHAVPPGWIMAGMAQDGFALAGDPEAARTPHDARRCSGSGYEWLVAVVEGGGAVLA